MRVRGTRILALCVAAAAAALAWPQSVSASETIHRKTLPNGLRVILVENHSKPIVAGCLFANGGSRTEPPALSGLSHYYEHLIFRGGSTRQAELEYRKEMERLGEEFGYTTNDYTCFNFTVSKENFAEALSRSTDAWLNLKLTEAKVAKEREVVMGEYRQDNDRPDYRSYYQIERLMFRDHPYKRDTIGLKDVIEHASLATFRTFYQERYVPNQMILTLVGDFEADAALASVEKAFAPYRRGRADFELGLTEKPQTEFRVDVDSMKTPNTWIRLGFHVPPYSDPAAPAFTVLAYLLGGGSSSRLYTALKERNNLVTSVDADFETRKDPGIFLISAVMPPQNEGKVFGTVRDEIRRIATEEVPAAELERAKSALLTQYAFRSERMLDRADRLCRFALMSDVSLEPLWPSLLEGVKAEDLQRVAAAYLAADQASYAVVRPMQTTGPTANQVTALVEGWRLGWPALGERSASTSLRKELLPNGLTVLLKEDHSAPVVAVHTMARGGLWIETDAISGVSNMMATLLSRGAGTMSARDISDRADALGMTLQSDGGWDYAQIAWRAPSRNFAKAWELYRDVLLKPTFPTNEVAKVRQDLLSQVKSLGDRPFEYTNLQFQKSLYRKSPYRRYVLGDSVSLVKIQVADIRRAYETMFCARNLVVSIVGDFDAAAVLETARRAFAPLRSGTPVAVGDSRDKPADETHVQFLGKDQDQVTYNTGWLGCSVRDPDYVPLSVAVNAINTRVFFKYVYEKGVAYRSWFYMFDRLGQAPALNEMGVTPENFRMASSGVLEDIAQFTREGVGPAELKKTQDTMRSRYFLGAQSAAEVARRICYYEMAGLGYEFAGRYPDLLRKVTAAEVNAAARKYFDPARYTRVAVGKEESAAKEPATGAPSR